MLKRERKFYSEAFKERVLASYYSGNEPVSVEAARFDASRDTVGSWVYRKRTVPESKKRVKLALSGTDFMKREELSPEAKEARIREVEVALAKEKMRSECPGKNDRDSRTGVEN